MRTIGLDGMSVPSRHPQVAEAHLEADDTTDGNVFTGAQAVHGFNVARPTCRGILLMGDDHDGQAASIDPCADARSRALCSLTHQ